MDKEACIKKTEEFVRQQLKGAEGGHDWFHIQRVYRNALRISEGEEVDVFIVSLGALLHDIADPKFHDGNEEIAPQMARDFLESMGLEDAQIEHVIYIIKNISFKNSLDQDPDFRKSKELAVVQDADRLDAIGAIGIARAFNYGGFKNRPLYDPEVAPRTNLDKETYKKSQSPTINHFYEKLFLLKDRMNTQSGKVMAEERHRYMQHYLDRFLKEWKGQL